MATQEEWRKIRDETALGESGYSGGTLERERGYQKHQNEKARQRQYDADIRASVRYNTNKNTDSIINKNTHKNNNLIVSTVNKNHTKENDKHWFEFVDVYVNKIPKSNYWKLAFIGTMIAYVYVSSSIGTLTIGSSEAFFNQYVGPMFLGFIAGLIIIPLFAFAVKLVMTAIVLGLVAAIFYVAFMIYKGL